MRSREKGFSLIEFLLVLVIMLLVATLAIPQFQKEHQETNYRMYFGAAPPSSELACANEAPLIKEDLEKLQLATQQGDASARAKAKKNFESATFAAQLCPAALPQ